MTPQEMRVLYDYNAWANRRSLEAASALTAEKFVQPMGSSFGSVRDTLAHIWGAEWIWLERFQGRSPSSLPDATQFPDMASLRERWDELEMRLLGFVRGLAQADLDRVFEYKTLKFGVYRNPLWESMQHLANHGTYHRGQVTTLLRQLGAQPIATDLMHFYRERAKRECSTVIASIFVNPKQFGPAEDFSKYPRTFDPDREMLEQAGVNFLFAPEAAEIYPQGFSSYVQVDGLSERLEGRSRPGHFRGVATVVMKLLQIVQPNFAYFGRKDAQQSRLIMQMARDLNLDTEIVVCPPVREPDGLALSSRNVYLNQEERKAATVLFRALEAAKSELAAGVRDVLQLQTILQRTLGAERHARVDYAEIVDAESFEPVGRVNKPCYVVLAVFIGKTRLIDNLYVEPKSSDSDELVFHF